ncbi:MAG: bifunctional uridylyltransferase/uridylyl-removing protein, partial [Rhodospirillales bacterium]
MSRPYEKLHDRRAIVNRKALVSAFDALAATERDGTKLRGKLLADLKAALADGRAEIHRRFEADGAGLQVTAGTAYLMDQLIKVLFDITNEHVFPAANPT